MTTVASFSTDLKLSAYPQIDQNKNPDIYDDLQLVHSAIRTLQQYLDLYTGANIVGVAQVAISAGQFVAIGTAGGNNISIALANATGHTLPVIGFATTTAAAGAGITVQTSGLWPYGNVGLIPGTKYYLSTSSGTVTTTPPAAGGNLVQFVGVAIDANNILFKPSQKYSEI